MEAQAIPAYAPAGSSIGLIAASSGVMASPMALNQRIFQITRQAQGHSNGSLCARPITTSPGSQEGLQTDPTESEAPGLYLNGGAGYACLCACWQVHWTNGHPVRSHGQPHGLKPAHFSNNEASAWAFKWSSLRLPLSLQVLVARRAFKLTPLSQRLLAYT